MHFIARPSLKCASVPLDFDRPFNESPFRQRSESTCANVRALTVPRCSSRGIGLHSKARLNTLCVEPREILPPGYLRRSRLWSLVNNATLGGVLQVIESVHVLLHDVEFEKIGGGVHDSSGEFEAQARQ